MQIMLRGGRVMDVRTGEVAPVDVLIDSVGIALAALAIAVLARSPRAAEARSSPDP